MYLDFIYIFTYTHAIDVLCAYICAMVCQMFCIRALCTFFLPCPVQNGVEDPDKKLLTQELARHFTNEQP